MATGTEARLLDPAYVAEQLDLRERAFVRPAALYPAAFNATTRKAQLTASDLNKLIAVYPESATVTYTVTLPAASAAMLGSKINLSGPVNSMLIVESLKNQSIDNVIGVSLRGRGEFVVVDYGNGDYNWHTRSLDQPNPTSGSPGGTARDPYDVDETKRKQVVDADVPFLQETDNAYFGKKILNRTYKPNKPAKYECMADAPLEALNPSTGLPNPTTWWWVRTPVI